MRWQNGWLLALAAGIMMFVSWPEGGFPFLIFAAWWPLFRLSDLYLERKGIFWRLYVAFFLFNLLTTYWIWYATRAGAVMALLANSLLMSLTFWLWHKARKRLPLAMQTVLFPALWMSFEKLHYVWDLEWPWLTMGNVFASTPWAVQWYAYTGVFGGSLWVLAGSLWFYRLTQKRNHRTGWVKWGVFMLLPVLLSLVMYFRYAEKGTEARVLILQPNIDPWTEKFDRPNSQSLADLESMVPAHRKFDLIVAPETALARSMDLDRLGRNRVVQSLKRKADSSGAAWLVGVSLYRIWHGAADSVPETANWARQRRFWYQIYNSALFVAPQQQPALYHKAILVPGAEKMPYRKWFRPLLGDWIIDLGGMSGTHTPSPEPVVFGYDSLRVAPIICYESVFGDYVRRYVLRGANLLAVISNDGWWKKTSGYRQHFDYARLRAIETRRDVVRSANTGRSGLIDQRGRVVESLAYDRRGVIDATAHLNTELTFYVRYGDYLARLAVFLAGLLLAYAFLGRKRFT